MAHAHPMPPLTRTPHPLLLSLLQHNIQPIDIVVVNLYPFRQTVTAANKPSYEASFALI